MGQTANTHVLPVASMRNVTGTGEAQVSASASPTGATSLVKGVLTVFLISTDSTVIQLVPTLSTPSAMKE